MQTMTRLFSAWLKNEPTINGWLSLNNSFSAEIMAHAGFNSLTIDMQHGISDYSSLIAMMQAIKTKDIPIFVRVPWLEASAIMKSLDAGANAIICPMINNADDARLFASYCRYPPLGQRSFGPIRAKFLHTQDYFKIANENIFVCAMIETKEALANLDEILSVCGIDGVYIGPADLSCSLGVSPKFDQEDEKVLKAIELVLNRAKAHKKYAGIHNLSPQYAKKMADLGFNFLTLGSDANFMLQGAKEVLAQYKCC